MEDGEDKYRGPDTINLGGENGIRPTPPFNDAHTTLQHITSRGRTDMKDSWVDMLTGDVLIGLS